MYTFDIKNSKYEYRLFISQWPLWFSFNVDIMLKSQFAQRENCIEVSDGLWICVLDGSTEYKIIFGKDISNAERFIQQGVKMINDQIIEKSPFINNTLIIFRNFSISYCDFQYEGLTDAVLKWAELELGVQIPETIVNFNKKLNKYEFTYKL